MFVEKSFQAVYPGGTHKIVYSEFPGDASRTIICLHGLSRNGRDFDWLAQSLALDGYRVICPDMAGRNRSEMFNDAAHYNYPQYLSDIQQLLMEIGSDHVDWIGTSMGGLLGMMMAVMPSLPIKRMVINDVGPFISAQALVRIKDYVGINPYYRDWDSFAAAFRKRFQTFGLKNDAEWDFLMKISAERDEQGRFRMNYDPRIVSGLAASGNIGDLDLWPLWDLVKQPLLLLRGGESDVLTQTTLDRMMVGKHATSIVFAGAGHAPALLAAEQISVIRTWLRDTAA